MDFDPFAELQLSPEAEPELVKAAFKALAKKYHPDRFSDPIEKAEAEEKMARINEAQRLIQSGKYRPPAVPQSSPPPAEEVQFRQEDTVSLGSVRPQPKRPAPSQKEKQVPLVGIVVGGLLFGCLLALPTLFKGDHLERALEFENRGEYRLSLEQLNEAVSKDPHNRELYGHRARIWEKLGEPERAAVDLKNAETPTLQLPTETSATPAPPDSAETPKPTSSPETIR